MATQTAPTLLSSVRCAVGIPVDQPIRSFVVLPQSDHLLTLEGAQWVTRSLRTGQVNPQIPPTPWQETAAMWTERVPSPDDRWLIALNGQASIEARLRERLNERQMLTWTTGLPKGYGFWAPDNNFFLAHMEGDITEVWDLRNAQRTAYSPEPVGESNYVSHWPPALPDESYSLQLILTRAIWHRKGLGAQGEFRPMGRWPVAGGGIGYDLHSALIVTGRRPAQPQPDSWIGGEVIRYDLATCRPVTAAAHSVLSGGALRVWAAPSLSHLFVGTHEGSLACVEATTGRTVYTIGHRPSCTAAAFTMDGQQCLVGLDDGEVQFVAQQADRVVWCRRAHEFAILHAELSADGTRAVTIGADRSLVCWDTASGNPLAGAPPRYDRVRDPLAFLQNALAAQQDLVARLGPPVRSVVVASDSFSLEFGGSVYRLPYADLSRAEVIWQGSASASPDRSGYTVYEPLLSEKKKAPKLGIYHLDPKTAQRELVASIDAPADATAYPLFVTPKRCLLPRKEGGLMLLRLDRKLFSPEVALDSPSIRVTSMGFYVSADGSAFALSHGAELRVYRSDDGGMAAHFVLEVPRREEEPAVVGCWIGPKAREVAVMLQSGTLQRWKF